MKNLKLPVLLVFVILSIACARNEIAPPLVSSDATAQSMQVEESNTVAPVASPEKLKGAVFFQTAADLRSLISQTLKENPAALQKVQFFFTTRIDTATVVVADKGKKSLSVQYYGFFDQPNPLKSSQKVISSKTLFVPNSSYDDKILSEALLSSIIKVLNKIDENEPRESLLITAAVRYEEGFSIEAMMGTQKRVLFITFDQDGKIVKYRDVENDENKRKEDKSVKESIPPAEINQSI